MTRKRTTPSDESTVLLATRRRCSICYGLERDTGIKIGQIAHIDQRNTNSSPDNLVFLCFPHHDQYDSKTSQSKNFTAGEVRAFRTELVAALGSAFSQTVHFGQIQTPAGDPYAGKYLRIGSDFSPAEIIVTPLPDDSENRLRYLITGQAYWGAGREYGPNMGFVDFIGYMTTPGIIEYDTDGFTGKRHIQIKFRESDLSFAEVGSGTDYGMNVTFDGGYLKA